MEKVKEIELIGEGMQLRKILEEKYPFEELLEIFQLKESSLRKQLAYKEIKGKAFRLQLETLFEKPYNEIVYTMKDQVRDYIVRMKNTIHDYNTSDDNRTVAKACELASKYCQLFEQMMAEANFIMCHINQLKYSWGPWRMEETIKKCSEYGFNDLVVYYSNLLVNFYYDEGTAQEKVQNALNRVQLILDDEDLSSTIPQEDKYDYYSIAGELMRDWGEYQQAKDMYHRSLDHTNDEVKIAASYNKIGSTHYLQGEYDTAIEWCNKSLDICKTDHDVMCLAENYLALTYNKKGDKDKMNANIIDMFEHLSSDTDRRIKIELFDTFNELGVFEALFKQMDEKKAKAKDKEI